ncbi:hypothetical protein QQS21_002970 [Conoideocrella luteorostrata]|uniref:DUF676 domain-containing protein n=1 Tax=Conoideocrella luteorostrata TaxID=1105319 RepID=A0AAJ0FWT7_9HYPO|nr:hypothetical protein QQS21_002970 [Conoideocrella luteorostrata]
MLLVSGRQHEQQQLVHFLRGATVTSTYCPTQDDIQQQLQSTVWQLRRTGAVSGMVGKIENPVFRVTGLANSQPDGVLRDMLAALIKNKLPEEANNNSALSIAIVPSCYGNQPERVAIIEFNGAIPDFLSGLTQNPLEEWQEVMGGTDISFDQHFFGFTQLYTPKPDYPITADIVAITGLGGHAYGSWRSKKNLGRMWLHHFLEKDLPCCRTMTYGYNSKLSSQGIDILLDYGRELIEELRKIRSTEEQRQRPLFFIAHSFGGLIVSHCLIKASQTNEEDDLAIASLYKATYGMLLFAIPHKGLVVDDVQKMLSGQEHPRNGLLKEINTSSDSLASQLAQFKNVIRDRKVVSFYETAQTRKLEFNHESQRWERTGDFMTVAGPESALLQLPDYMEDKIPLAFDHSMIVKFDSNNARGYTSVRDRLRKFEIEAPKVVQGRFAQSDRKLPVEDTSQNKTVYDHDFKEQRSSLLDSIHRMADLASIFRSNGQFNQAHDFCSRALVSRVQVLGDMHPDTIRSRADLAAILHDQKKFTEAREVGVTALQQRKNVLGDRHPDTLESCAVLANIESSLGNHQCSRQLRETALDTRTEIWGENNLDTIRSKADLASSLRIDRQYDLAYQHCSKALVLREQLLGDKHPDTIRCRADLAAILHDLKRFGEARIFGVMAVDQRKEVLGLTHPDTLNSYVVLANIECSLGNHQESLALRMLGSY